MLPALKSTLKNTFIYSVGTFSSRLAGFILIPLYTAHFSVEEYGMMGIMDVSAQVLVALLGFGLYNAYFRWYWDSRYISRQKSILFTILIFIFFQFIIFFILLFTFQKDLSVLLFDTDERTSLIRLLLYVNCFETIGVLISALLRLKEQAVYYTVLQVIKFTVGLLVTIYLVLNRGRNIEAVY